MVPELVEGSFGTSASSVTDELGIKNDAEQMADIIDIILCVKQ